MDRRTLVGHGSGANMAYLLGIRHPDLFTGVIAAKAAEADKAGLPGTNLVKAMGLI